MRKIFTGLISLCLVCLWMGGCVPGETQFPEGRETPGVLSTQSELPGTETLPALGAQGDSQSTGETVISTVTATATVTPSPTSSPQIPTTTAIATIVNTSTPNQPAQRPTLRPITPEIVRICPEQPEVSLAEMNLEGTWLVNPYDPLLGKVDENVSGVVIVPLDDLIPQKFSITATQDSWILTNYRLSDDGKSIELYYVDESRTKLQKWNSSVDGLQQWKVDEYDLGSSHHQYIQVEESKYLIIQNDDHPNNIDGSDTPLLIYDYKTGEKKDLTNPNFPETVNIRSFLTINGDAYLLNLRGSEVDDIALYNMATFEETPVFQWLIDKDWVYNLSFGFYYKDGRFYLKFSRDYGMDLGIDLDLETITSQIGYAEVMQAIYLPGPDGPHDTSAIFLDHPKGYLIWRYTQEKPQVYFLNLATMTLKDFCYSIENLFIGVNYTEYAISPDQRYIAFTHIKNGSFTLSPDEIIGVEVFDLETGLFARVPDANYAVIGWVEGDD